MTQPPRDSASDRPDASDAHLALQEVLGGPDTLASARSSRRGSPLKRFFVPIAAKIVHFFADRQVEWNFAVARALEAMVRSLDERDRWIGRLVERLRAAEDRVDRLEAELRGARQAEEDARRKLALLGIRLRDLEGRDPGLERRVETQDR